MHPFSYSIKQNGFDFIPDIEVGIECDAELIGDEPVLSATAVYGTAYKSQSITDDQGKLRVHTEKCTFDLLKSDDCTLVRLAYDIIAAAETDDDFMESVMGDAGYTYIGNGNDPDAGWRAT